MEKSFEYTENIIGFFAHQALTAFISVVSSSVMSCKVLMFSNLLVNCNYPLFYYVSLYRSCDTLHHNNIFIIVMYIVIAVCV